MKVAVVFILECPSPAIFQALAEACYRFSPQIAINPGQAVFLEIGKCRHLYSEKGLELRIQTLAARFQCKTRFRVAETAAQALAQARHDCDFERLPLSALLDYASPFLKDPDVAKKVASWVQTLELLGLKTAVDFARLPASSLSSRFGKMALELTTRIRGQVEPPWPIFRLEEKISERADIGEPTTDLEPLIFVLRGLTDHAMARLRGRAERALVFELKLELEKWSTLPEPVRVFRIELSLPQGSTGGVLSVFQDYLGFYLQRKPLEAPVLAIELHVLESVPGWGAQRDFFSKREEEREAWDALVGFLSHKLGQERVFLAKTADRYLPEKAWNKTLELKDSEIAPQQNDPRRPSRILKNPIPLGKNGKMLMDPSGRRWNVLKWEGPERLTGEWWAKAYQRDYYRVFTERGDQLWVFLDNAKFYLQGYFD